MPTGAKGSEVRSLYAPVAYCNWLRNLQRVRAPLACCVHYLSPYTERSYAPEPALATHLQ